MRRRDDAVVIVAAKDYRKLTGASLGFKEFLLGSGPSMEGLDLARDRSPAREADL